MTKLAAQYGLSDNGLRKVCVSLDIPLPPRGYWAKLAAGHKVARPPLKDPGREKSFVSHPPPIETRPFQSPDDDAWLEVALLREGEREPVQIDPAPSRWHPALTELKKRLTDAAADAEKARRDHEREEERRRKNPRAATSPNQSGYTWKITHGGIGLLLATHKASAIRVTTGTYKTALALLNAVFRTADDRGVNPYHDENRGRFILEVEGSKLEFAVRERLEDEWRDRVRWDGKTEKEKYSAATGRLVLAVYKNGYDSRQIKADAEGGWGHLSAALFQPLYRKVVQDRERRREAAERERQYEAHRQEVKRQEQERAEREEQARKERERETALINDAANWQKAELVRAYVEANIASGRELPEDWCRWARDVAERLDPLRRPLSTPD